MFKLTTLLLLILGSSACNCQWISSGVHEWEASLAPESVPASLLSLRSSEEQPMKSPLASHDFMIEATPITMDRQIYKKKPIRTASRKPSPVPSADKWWKETMKSRQNDGLVRITPYEYPAFPAGLEGPEFLPMPLKYRKAGRKNFKKVEKAAEPEVEMERVSANPPEFLPSEVETLQVPTPKLRKSNPKGKKVAYSVRSDRVMSGSDDLSERNPLIPDKMLGNDMLFHHNRLEEGSRSGNDVDDPNDDFELIQ